MNTDIIETRRRATRLAVFFGQKNGGLMHVIRIYFDGGCKPNPGAGYGSYEIKPVALQYHHKAELVTFGFMTSNMAEYHAMLHALKKLWHDSRAGNVMSLNDRLAIQTSRMPLHIFSDSQILVQQMTGNWKCKAKHISELVSEARLVLKEFGHWKISWRPRRYNVERFGH